MQTTLPSFTDIDTDDLTVDDLRNFTNSMIDTVLDLLKDCTDADVTFEPSDPGAYDSEAATDGEVNMPWTLGHLIVHATASAEEAAALAAELARGVEHHGRSRSEVPWQSVTTVEQCRQRLEESRRMRLASLDMWPDKPYYNTVYVAREGAVPSNCNRRFVNGLRHGQGHLAQIKDVIAQAKANRV